MIVREDNDFLGRFVFNLYLCGSKLDLFRFLGLLDLTFLVWDVRLDFN